MLDDRVSMIPCEVSASHLVERLQCESYGNEKAEKQFNIEVDSSAYHYVKHFERAIYARLSGAWDRCLVSVMPLPMHRKRMLDDRNRVHENSIIDG